MIKQAERAGVRMEAHRAAPPPIAGGGAVSPGDVALAVNRGLKNPSSLGDTERVSAVYNHHGPGHSAA